VKTHHDLPSSINVGVEQSKDVLERNVGLGRSENGRPMTIEIGKEGSDDCQKTIGAGVHGGSSSSR
jgi:hypothetical protein